MHHTKNISEYLNHTNIIKVNVSCLLCSRTFTRKVCVMCESPGRLGPVSTETSLLRRRYIFRDVFKTLPSISHPEVEKDSSI